MANIFKHFSYRDVIAELVQERKKTDPSFSFSKLGPILNVQKTYLSKVMHEHADLSTDQLFSLMEFFNLSSFEQEFLSLLLEHARTGLASRRQILRQKIMSIQSQQRDTKKNLKAKFVGEVQPDSMADYYLDPYVTIFHVALTIPTFGGDPLAVAKHFNIDEAHAKKVVLILERLHIIEKAKGEKGLYRVLEDHLHLSANSPLITPYHCIFRMASTQQLLKLPVDRRFAFSVTFSADAATQAKIHEGFIRFLNEVEPLVKAAPADKVYQINFDLFPWT